MQITRYIQTSRLGLFHELIQVHNGRYVYSPLEMFNDKHMVSVSFDDVRDANRFESDWQRLNTPIREVLPSKWTRLARKVKGRWMGLCSGVANTFAS